MNNKIILLSAISLLGLVSCGGGGDDPGPGPGPTPGTSYTINTPTITHGSVVGTAPTSIEKDGTANFVFKADSGYALPNKVSVTGATFDYTTSGSQGTIVLSNPTSNVTIADITCLATFSSDTWENVINYANQGLAKLHEVYKTDCDKNTKFPGTLIGLERTIKINDLDHIVKVIGEGHDKLSSDTSKTAALTFDFTTYISDGAISTVKTKWNDSVSNEWASSTIRTFMSTVKELFPNNIKNAIKKVKKQTYDTTSSTNVEYDEEIFPLAVRELGYTGDTSAKETCAIYKYYQSATKDSDSLRNKKYANGKMPAMGDPYWLRSPCTKTGAQSWLYAFKCSGATGYISSLNFIPDDSGTLAPAFCI